MNEQSYSTAVRRFPHKPEAARVQPVQRTVDLYASKEIDTDSALRILKSFYHEAKKELRKEERSRVTMNADSGMSQLVFCGEGFTISLIAS